MFCPNVCVDIYFFFFLFHMKNISIVGVTIISNTDKGVNYSFPPGAVWSILGAFFYAAYIVLLRRKIDNEELLDFPMFFGRFLFCSVYHLLCNYALTRYIFNK